MRGGNTLLIILLAGLLIGLIILVTHHDQGQVAGISTEQFGQLVVLLSIGIFIGAGVWRGTRGRLPQSLTAIVFWLVIALLLAIAYSYKDMFPQFSGAMEAGEWLVSAAARSSLLLFA